MTSQQNDRWVILGESGTGKSTRMRVMANAYDGNVIFFDTIGDWLVSPQEFKEIFPGFDRTKLGRVMEGKVIGHPAARNKLMANLLLPESFHVVFSPIPHQRERELERTAWALKERHRLRGGRAALFLDECSLFMHGNQMHPAVRDLSTGSRHWNIDVVLAAQRPMMVSQTALSQATHLLCFGMSHPDDIRIVEKLTNPNKINAKLLKSLNVGEAVLWNKRKREASAVGF